MEIPSYSLSELFDQLGLDSNNASMNAFLESHQLPTETSLENAGFWNPSQIHFFYEERSEDAIWGGLIDLLDVLLHKESMTASTHV